jgi:hypothetical protein
MKIILVFVTRRRVEAVSPGSIGGSHYLHTTTPQQAAQAEVRRRGWHGIVVPAEMPEYTLPGRGDMHAFVLV